MFGATDRDDSQLWVVAMYVGLIVAMMIFLVIFALLGDRATYQIAWIPDVTKTILDAIKVLVGAVIGALTPVAVNRSRRLGR